MGRLVAREPCPKCQEEGRDKKGDNLYVYEDGSYCHAGHGRIASMAEPRMITNQLTVSDCLDNPIGHNPARCISEEVYKPLGIRVAYDTATGNLKRIYYPYKGNDGIVTGVKVRNVEKKEFYIAGKLGGVFGKPTANNPKGSLIVTEGEEDALAVREILHNTPYAVNDVVSLPNGANITGQIDKDVKADLDFFQKYSRIILCLDMDTPGKATAKSLAEWLSGFVSSVLVAKLPMKDASECLVAGMRAEVIEAIKSAEKFAPEGIVHGSEISISDLIRSAPKGFDTPYPELNDKLKGIRKSEILTVCAASGIGKSTLVTEIAYDLVVRHGLTVCHIALENIVEATAATYIAMDNNVPVALFRNNPSIIEESAIEDSMDRTVRKMYFFKHFGSIDSAEFKNKLMYYARSGVDFIILDHLSMVISGSDVSNERKEIDKIMTDLASMVVETGVGLINVVHLKRRETGSKDRGLNEGGQVSLTDLRGSAALEQLSWSVVAMERNQQAEDGSEDYSYLRILKNRTWGRTGKAGRVKYNHMTGRLLPAPEEIENEEPHPLGASTDPLILIAEEPSSETLESLLGI